jgi:TonB family protein
MTDKKKSSGNLKYVWILSAVFALVLLAGGAFLIKVLIKGNDGKRQRHIQMVTLLKPPPPPKIKEKPPEPEVKKKEEIKEEKPPPRETPEKAQDDDTPAGKDLGLDADGSAGSDGFGLVGKKGGRALIGGKPSGYSLLREYAWYTRIVQEAIRKKVKKTLDENGGIPKGKLEAIVKILLDDRGNIMKYRIIGSSGDHAMDHAVEEAVKVTRIDEPPPDGMPRAVKIKISSKG